MYCIEESPKDWAEKDVWAKLPLLLEEVLGYTSEDIKIFKDLDTKKRIGALVLAIDLTREQAILIQQPFTDNNIPLMCYEYDDTTKRLVKLVFNSELGVTKQPPKKSYYDEPIISSRQRIDPRVNPYCSPCVYNYTSSKSTPTITCPYCKSTNCKKISALSKAGSVFMWGIFAMGKASKEWHCNNCNSNF